MFWLGLRCGVWAAHCRCATRCWCGGCGVQAEKTAQLFLRDGDTSGTASLYDMQHMWYEVAAGAAHMRREEYGKVRARTPTGVVANM